MANTFTLEATVDTQMFLESRLALINNLTKSTVKGMALSTEITLGDVAISNGRQDAIRCLKLLPHKAQVATVLPVVKRVAKFSTDTRVHSTIDDLGKWVAGDKTIDLKAAFDVANEVYMEAVTAHEDGDTASAAVKVRAIYAACAVANIAALAAGVTHDKIYEVSFVDAVCAVSNAPEPQEAERKLQLADIIEMHPPILLTNTDVIFHIDVVGSC